MMRTLFLFLILVAMCCAQTTHSTITTGQVNIEGSMVNPAVYGVYHYKQATDGSFVRHYIEIEPWSTTASDNWDQAILFTFENFTADTNGGFIYGPMPFQTVSNVFTFVSGGTCRTGRYSWYTDNKGHSGNLRLTIRHMDDGQICQVKGQTIAQSIPYQINLPF